MSTLFWTLGALAQTPQPGPAVPFRATATKAIRIGDVAQKLSNREIAALERVIPNGAKPWILFGETSPVVGGLAPSRLAYLLPTTNTAALLRGSAVGIRKTSCSTWSVVGDPAAYAQVVYDGITFGAIPWDQPINLPFRVIGRFEDAELVSVVKYIRETQTSSERRIRLLGVGFSPIWSVVRGADDSVAVTLGEHGWAGQTLTLRQKGQAWEIVRNIQWVN